MTEEIQKNKIDRNINYYEILFNLTALLEKLKRFSPSLSETGDLVNNDLELLRLEALKYIYSEEIVKQYFVDKVRSFNIKSKTEEYQNLIRIKAGIIQNLDKKKYFFEDDFWFENDPFRNYYYSYLNTSEYCLAMNIRFFYFNCAPKIAEQLYKERNDTSMFEGIEYYIVYSALSRYLDDMCTMGFSASALYYVLDDLYSYIARFIKREIESDENSFEILPEHPEQNLTGAQLELLNKIIKKQLYTDSTIITQKDLINKMYPNGGVDEKNEQTKQRDINKLYENILPPVLKNAKPVKKLFYIAKLVESSFSNKSLS